MGRIHQYCIRVSLKQKQLSVWGYRYKLKIQKYLMHIDGHLLNKSFPYCCSCLCWPGKLFWIKLLFCRAGHAKILPRQCGHVFEPQSCVLLQYYYISIFGVATPSRHRDLNIFQIFSGPCGSITLSCCRCHEANKLLRAPLCFFVL